MRTICPFACCDVQGLLLALQGSNNNKKSVGRRQTVNIVSGRENVYIYNCDVCTYCTYYVSL